MKYRVVLVLSILIMLLYMCLQLNLIGELCSPLNADKPIINTKSRCSTSGNGQACYIFPDSQARSVLELERRNIPNIFHFVFCHRNLNHMFMFNHYLSVLSVWRNFEPDGIELHYNLEITQDKYNTWLDQLKASIPSLILKKMSFHWLSNEVCALSYGLAVLQDRGGVYLTNDVILTKYALSNLENNFNVLVDDKNNIKVIFSKRKHPKLNNVKITKQAKLYLNDNASMIRLSDRCVDVTDFSFQYATKCFVLQHQYLPLDLFESKHNGCQYLQSLYQREPHITETCNGNSQPEYYPIPRIVHYIWFHPRNISFMMYLSLISTLYVVKPDKVYIHGDLQLSGYYWDKIKDDPRIVLVYRESPFQIYGHRIKYTTHGSDVVRADILLKYGGIYLDWDVIWLQSVDSLLSSGSSVIANFDHMVANKAFPAQLNLGVVIAIPRSTFIQKWRNAFINYRSDDFYYNALELPYKIYERYPDSINIEKRLQVMCYHLKCHPIFHKDYRDWTHHQTFDWRQVFSIHFTYPDPPEYTSEDTLYNSSGLFSEIGKYILSQVKQN